MTGEPPARLFSYGTLQLPEVQLRSGGTAWVYVFADTYDVSPAQ
jgi:hypothetical protein